VRYWILQFKSTNTSTINRIQILFHCYIVKVSGSVPSLQWSWCGNQSRPCSRSQPHAETYLTRDGLGVLRAGPTCSLTRLGITRHRGKGSRDEIHIPLPQRLKRTSNRTLAKRRRTPCRCPSRPSPSSSSSSASQAPAPPGATRPSSSRTRRWRCPAPSPASSASPSPSTSTTKDPRQYHSYLPSRIPICLFASSVVGYWENRDLNRGLGDLKPEEVLSVQLDPSVDYSIVLLYEQSMLHF
jgi:hypothetical protein